MSSTSSRLGNDAPVILVKYCSTFENQGLVNLPSLSSSYFLKILLSSSLGLISTKWDGLTVELLTILSLTLTDWDDFINKNIQMPEINFIFKSRIEQFYWFNSIIKKVPFLSSIPNCIIQQLLQSMKNLFPIAIFLFLLSLTSTFSIVANLTISSSPIFDVQLNSTSIYYISRNIIYDTEPLKVYHVNNKSTSIVENSQAANTIFMGNNQMLLSQENKIFSLDPTTFKLELKGSIQTHDIINSISSVDDKIYAVTTSGHLCQWKQPDISPYCKVTHAFNATLVDAVNSDIIVTAGQDRNLKIWDSSLKNIATFIYESKIRAITHSKKYIAVGDSVGVVKLYSIEKMVESLVIKINGSIMGVNVLEKWGVVVVVLQSGSCRIYNMKGEEQERLDSDISIVSVGWTEDGFITGHKNGVTKIWKY